MRQEIISPKTNMSSRREVERSEEYFYWVTIFSVLLGITTNEHNALMKVDVEDVLREKNNLTA